MTVKVRKRIDLHGDTESDLKQRIEILGEAVRVRKGTIIDVQWRGRNKRGLHSARVRYELPAVVAPLATTSDGAPRSAPPSSEAGVKGATR